MGTDTVAGPVVVGIDGSLESVDAARHAADAAARRDVDLLVVHAYARPEGRVAAQRLVDDTLAQVRVAPTTVVRRLVQVASAQTLLAGLSREALLVVVGQHHFDLADGLVIGAVASEVAASAGCPVVVVPAGWTRTPRRTAVLARRPIVAGLDEETSAAAVLQLCFEEAELRQSSVLVLHAAPPAAGRAGRSDDLRAMAEIVAAQKQDHPDIVTTSVVVPGEALDALTRASAQASLLVLGRPHRHHGARSWRHSVARSVMHQAQCPLVVVPPDLRARSGALLRADARAPVS